MTAFPTLRGLLLLVVVLSTPAIGCQNRGNARPTTPEVAFNAGLDEVDFSTDILIPLWEGATFEFCPHAGTLNLTNATWLAFLAANEYSHFGHLAPILEDLGFGDYGEGRRWAECGRDLYALRTLRDSGVTTVELPDESEWGRCARDWIADYDARGGARPEAGLSGVFAYDLVRRAHEGWNIEFFSEGQIVDDGSFRSGSTQALWARHRQIPIVIVVFRGTELRRGQRVPDVISDIDVRWSEYPGWGEVHRGFQRSFENIYDGLIEEKLRQIEGEGLAIWVTGHSLGAALATLMVTKIIDEIDQGADLELAGLYTFGSPRVGNHEFAERFHEAAESHGFAAFRFRNANDAVTRVPISLTTVGGFEHVGRLVLFDREGRLLIEPEHVPHGIGNAISDHSMDTYFQRVFEHARQSPTRCIR